MVLDYKVRAFNPFPVCYGVLDGQRVKIWQANPIGRTAAAQVPGTILRADKKGIAVSCGNGELVIEVLQLEGKKPLEASQLLSAYHALFAAGKRFTLPVASANT